jgi:hypothetical protein
VCHLQLLLVLASTADLKSESRGTRDHILFSQIRDSPSIEGQDPVFISPRNRVVQLYPQALGSVFVASYESQGYGGGNRRRLHKGTNPCYKDIPVIYPGSDAMENTVFSYCCRSMLPLTVSCLANGLGEEHIRKHLFFCIIGYVCFQKCLLCRCLAMLGAIPTQHIVAF